MNEEMTPDYMTGTPNTVCADARRQFSRIGLMFLVGTALIYGVQFGASAIANAINPDLLSSTSYALLIVSDQEDSGCDSSQKAHDLRSVADRFSHVLWCHVCEQLYRSYPDTVDQYPEGKPGNQYHA